MQWFGTGVLVKTAIIDEVGHGGVPHENEGMPCEDCVAPPEKMKVLSLKMVCSV